MENCKRILILFIQYQIIVKLIMVLMNVITDATINIVKLLVIYHKKSLDLVTGSFLL